MGRRLGDVAPVQGCQTLKPRINGSGGFDHGSRPSEGELKSFSPDVNFASLERELGNKTEGSYDDEFDKWADYTEYESADEESAEESA